MSKRASSPSTVGRSGTPNTDGLNRRSSPMLTPASSASSSAFLRDDGENMTFLRGAAYLGAFVLFYYAVVTVAITTYQRPHSGDAHLPTVLRGVSNERRILPALKNAYISLAKKHLERRDDSNSTSLSHLLPLLAAVQTRLRVDDPIAAHAAVLDIGARTGELTEQLMRSLSYTCTSTSACRPISTDVVVVSVEPSSAGFHVVRAMAESKGWGEVGWVGLHAAMGDGNGVTDATAAGTERASFTNKTGSAHVPMYTVDALLAEGFSADSTVKRAGNLALDVKGLPVLLLRIDTEGKDYLVLHGAESTLRARRVRFLLFSSSANRLHPVSHRASLRSTTDWLHDFGYLCYLVTPTALLPMYADWWDAAYEGRARSSVFCGIERDAYLSRVLDGLANSTAPGLRS